ncbi:MAG: hypothetical protein ACFFEE_08115 [Candidatus Thorarchaeota archaeon]
MKRNVRIGLVLLAAIMLLVLAAGNVIAHQYYESSCSTGETCHDDPSGLSITMASSIDVATGETFQLDVTATGLSSDVFVLRIPDDVDNNEDFTIVIPDNADDPGLVSDNDGNDQDPTENAIQTTYNITAPAFSGTFTLTVFAAQHIPSSISASITVNVASEGPGPAIGAPVTTPEVPRAGEDFTVSVGVTSVDTITYVRLQYSLDGGDNWDNITMTEVDGVYTGTIPASVNSANDIEVRLVSVQQHMIGFGSHSRLFHLQPQSSREPRYH